LLLLRCRSITARAGRVAPRIAASCASTIPRPALASPLGRWRLPADAQQPVGFAALAAYGDVALRPLSTSTA